jgi:putative colanic acid biosynthesis UDP-glucose lipid carrier transferase
VSIQDQPSLPSLFADADLRLWVPSQAAPILDAKRALDIAVSAAAILFLMPLLALISLAVTLDSRGPVLFCQRRRGQGGEIFGILKFRTMRVLEDGGEVVQAKKHDDRITRVGRFLRVTSLDELPQLINVLLGDMSLVGPRPHALAHDEYYGARISTYAKRQQVKPGITGWAQVNGARGETPELSDMRKRIDFDAWYVDHKSFGLDLLILAKTPKAVLSMRNAG